MAECQPSRVNTNWGVAENALIKDGQDAASRALADGGADGRELIGRCHRLGC